jgi:hypothetical protein
MLFGDLGIADAERYIQEVLKITRVGISRHWCWLSCK